MFDDRYELAYALAMSGYDQTIEQLKAEMNSLADARRKLEERLRFVQDRLHSVMQAIVIMEDLAGRANSTFGGFGETLSDKIRNVLLRSHDQTMTAREIKSELAKLGFKFDGDPRPMATIHSILQRLVTASKPVIGEAPRKNGRKAWRQIAWRQEGEERNHTNA
jgi:hypothetical protein